MKDSTKSGALRPGDIRSTPTGKSNDLYKIIIPWGLFLFSLVLVIFAKIVVRPLIPVWDDYGTLSDYSIWQIPIVYVASYITKAWSTLLFAFLLGGMITVLIPRDKLQSMLSSKRLRSYFLAALFAPLLTVCSCAMIPIFGSLIIAGAGVGPAITFLLMAPAANFIAIIFTVELISWKIALFRILFSFAGAVVIGYIISRTPIGRAVEQKFAGIKLAKVSSGDARPSLAENSWQFMLEGWYLAKKVLPYLGIGVVIVAFVEAYFPPQIVAEYLTGIRGILLASVIGVPTYTPSLVEVFLIQAMLTLGMSPAAALAFLIGAPMASLPSMMAVSKVVGWKLVLMYAALAVVVAAIAGIVYLNAVTVL